MEQQGSFAEAEFAAKKRTTRREKFLGRMEEVVPWAELLAVIGPFFPQGLRGRPPVGLERMLRVLLPPAMGWPGGRGPGGRPLRQPGPARLRPDRPHRRRRARRHHAAEVRRLLETNGLC